MDVRVNSAHLRYLVSVFRSNLKEHALLIINCNNYDAHITYYTYVLYVLHVKKTRESNNMHNTIVSIEIRVYRFEKVKTSDGKSSKITIQSEIMESLENRHKLSKLFL